MTPAPKIFVLPFHAIEKQKDLRYRERGIEKLLLLFLLHAAAGFTFRSHLQSTLQQRH
jgi:hypothetical protein